MSYLLGTTPIVATSSTHLWDVVREILLVQGEACDLNHIDVSGIEDFSQLFGSTLFNGDVSKWNMSNAKDISGMFEHSPFQGDLSQWDVSNVINASCMFLNSRFNGDLSQWQPDRLQCARWMFRNSKFEGSLSHWTLPSIDDITEFCDDQTLRHWPEPTLYHWYALLNNPICLSSIVHPIHAAWHRAMEQQATALACVWQQVGMSQLEAARWLHEQWRAQNIQREPCALPLVDFLEP